MFSSSWYIYGLGLPGAICAVAVIVTGMLFRKHHCVTTGPGWALGVGGGFFAGYWAVNGWPKRLPYTPEQWLTLVVLPVFVIVTSFGPFPDTRFKDRVILRAVQMLLGFGAVLLLLKTKWNDPSALVLIPILGGVSVGLWLLLDQIKQRDPGRWVVLMLSMVAAGTGVVVIMSNSQSVGQYGLSLAATLGGGVVGSFILPREARAPATTGLVVVLLVGIWVNGYYFANVTLTNAILLSASPLGAWAGDFPVLRGLKGWRSAAVRIFAVGIPVAVAIVLAAIKFQKEMSSQTGYY